MSENKLMHTKGTVRPWYAYASTPGDSTEDVSCVRLRLVKTMLYMDQVHLIHNCKAYVKGVSNVSKHMKVESHLQRISNTDTHLLTGSAKALSHNTVAVALLSWLP